MASTSVSFRSLLLLSLFTPIILTAPTASTRETCTRIQTSLTGKVSFPKEAAYIKENKDYYNSGLAELGPACIVFPTSANDVSLVVKILNGANDVQFAVKSGGHSPNPGAASTKDGVLIALRHINGTVLDKQTSLATVKPGGHWWDVMKALDGTGQMVVGGRLGVVGIGGYLMQGGVSFLSGQYGLGGDNVVAYEMVLANGSIVNIHQDQHKGLVTAMRGAGSQFGIVTKFTVRTYPIGKFYSGVRIYNTTREKFNDAVQDFISNLPNFPKAATLMPFGDQQSGGKLFGGMFGKKPAVTPQSQIRAGLRSLDGYEHFDQETRRVLEDLHQDSMRDRSEAQAKTKMFTMPILYDGPSLPAGVFGKKFDALPVWKETGSAMEYKSMVAASDAVWDYISFRTSFRTITLPVLPNHPGYLGDIEDIFANVSAKYTKQAKGLVGIGLVLQPFPRNFGKASEERGGNAMGLSGRDHDRFVLEIPGIYAQRADDETMQAWGRDFTNQVTKYLKQTLTSAKAKGVNVGEYNPYFMNDAGTDQDVIGTYRDNAKHARLQRELDPTGLWSRRAGGYKYKTVA